MHPHGQITAGLALASLFLVPDAAASSTFTGVPSANHKSPNTPSGNVLTPELVETRVVQGSTPIENGTASIPYFGYRGDGPLLPPPGAVQAPGSIVEATKTEPDKNTYLVLHGQSGPDAAYAYGSHFLFQGHETGGSGFITRVNLDADAAHRVTLMAYQDVLGNPLPVFDGSTWDPFCRKLLFTFEGGASGGVWQATLSYPSSVTDISGYLGRGGYEAVQNDGDGNVWIVEDVGGTKGLVNSHARQPNSYVFRYVPVDRGNLTAGGRLEALQVVSLISGTPIVFHAGQADADILSADVADLHTYGREFVTHWVTVHDTAVDGTAPFDANARAKAASATPFKRPENGVFRPGTGFQEFVFTETGDTDLNTEAGSQYGGFGALFTWKQTAGSSVDGTLKLLFRGDAQHAAFDNIAFWDATRVVAVEDRGDGLHSQLDALDSAWMFDASADYGNASTPAPVRILAQGRDYAATIDSALVSISGNGFQNEGDNELTGIHVSDGNPRAAGILGARVPTPFAAGWRVFYTQQHGENVIYEILPSAD